MIRNYALDNAKYLMILLVVFGHLIEPLINDSVMIKALYMSIYSYHMPVFVILAGMMTKTSAASDVRKIVVSILVPFLAFTLILELVTIILFGRLSNYSLNFSLIGSFGFCSVYLSGASFCRSS